MIKRHMKTLTVPVSWPIKRKEKKFIVRPKPGKTFALSMPLTLVFREILSYGKTAKEVRTILRDKEILIDGVRKKDPRTLLGLMDVLSLPLLKENYRMLVNRIGKLSVVKIDDSEAGTKIVMIRGKTTLSKGKVQLNLSDGRNMLVKDDKFKVGDSLLIKVPSQEIVDTFSMEKGNYAFLISGSHVGSHGEIASVESGLIKIKTKDGSFETPKESVFVVGKDKPAIKMLD